MYSDSLYTAGMRAVAILAVVGGCGFRVPGAGDDATIVDAAVDAGADAAPDAFVPLPACMTDVRYTNGPVAGHRYRRTDSSDRDGAVDACAADGAHLAVIETPAEDAFVHAFGNSDFWIGYDDLKTEGTFRWVKSTLTTYDNFQGSEPNDSGVEDCTYVQNGNGSWNDTNCGDQRPAVCECEANYVPRPTPVCRGMQGNTHDGRKYIIHEGTGSAKAWLDAKADCEAVGAHLAVFADREEEDPVNGEFSSDNWMGLSDAATEGTFLWLDGTLPAYTHWNLTSPHGASTIRNCVRVNIEWEDQDCTLLKEYACECEP